MSESEPGDDKRASNAVPKTEPQEDSSALAPDVSRRGWFGGLLRVLGIFLLLVLAAVGGGLSAIYWPRISGTGTGNTALADRVGALETRIGQIAAGQTPNAASLKDMQQKIAALQSRVESEEARLSTLENSGGTGSADLAPLKSALDKNNSAIAALDARLQKLEQSSDAAQVATNTNALATLRTNLDTQTKTTTDALAMLGARVAQLEKTAPPADLAQRLDSFALKSGLAALQMRIARLENRDTAGLVKRAASVLALADLVHASQGAAPFEDELAALKPLVPASPEMTTLAKYAPSGVPTEATLAARFAGRADSIIAAERTAHANNWAERAWAHVVNLVSVRRIGNVSGNTTGARVARAQFALGNGNLAAAIADVEGLDTPAKAAAASWLKDARGRLAVDRAARTLTSRVVTALADEAKREPPQTPAPTDAAQ